MADKADIEAARWVARLQSSDATAQDKRDFEIWLNRDAAHAEVYESFSKLWGDLKHVPVTEAQLKRIKRKKRASSSRGIAALLIVVAFSGTAYRMGYADRWRSDYYTVAGEVRSVQLTDGTRVDLNTDTAIAVHYSDNERRVELLRGEAFFEVVKNPARAFIVESGALTAKALGTNYAVRTASGAFGGEVQVEEGRVEVTTKRNMAVLEAGDVAELVSGNNLLMRKRDVTLQTAWRDGKLIFSERPLQDVVATLARYRSGRIVVLDNAQGAQKVSGIFDVRDTDAALNALAQNLDIRVTRLTNMLVLISSQ